MMNNVYESTGYNAYHNLAFERQLADKGQDNVILYLWQNNNCVVIGRNQNALAECDMEYLNQNNIVLSRRYSGGGAVFHDLGNVNYTLIMQNKDYDIENVKKFLLKALNSLDLDVKFSGRNDMTINDAKFSGQAYYVHKNMHVFHGTLMVDLNIATLVKCLTPSKKKLEAKGIKSVKSRVINLIEVKPDLTIDSVKQALVKAFQEVYGTSSELVKVDESYVDMDLSNHLQSDKFLFEQSPAFNLEIEKRLSFGNMVLQLEIKNNKIKNVKVFTDSLLVEWDDLKENLIGRVFEEDNIWDIVENFPQK